MPTNRKRKPRHRIEPMPDWAEQLLKEKRLPARDTEAWNQLLGWMFFEESVPGLPDEAKGLCLQLFTEKRNNPAK